MDRIHLEAIDSIQRRINLFRMDAYKASNQEVLNGVCQTGAAYWDLYREGAEINAPGEVVCRHVAASLEAILSAHGILARVHGWGTRRVPGSPYGGHATLHVKVGGEWYYVEWRLGLDNRHHGYAHKVRQGTAEALVIGSDLEGLPIQAETRRPDCQWMRNRSFGREIINHWGRTHPGTLRKWRQEFLQQRLYNLKELRTDEARKLVGWGRGKRKVLA